MSRKDLEKRVADEVRYRVREEHKKYAHLPHIEDYEGKDFWIESTVRKLTSGIMESVEDYSESLIEDTLWHERVGQE